MRYDDERRYQRWSTEVFLDDTIALVLPVDVGVVLNGGEGVTAMDWRKKSCDIIQLILHTNKWRV